MVLNLFTMANNCFIFGSEIKSFKHPEFKKELEKQSHLNILHSKFFQIIHFLKCIFSSTRHYFTLVIKKLSKKNIGIFFDEPAKTKRL